MSDSDIDEFTSSSSLPDREWDKLLTSIVKGRVVPVIGPELLYVPYGAEPLVSLYDLWGQALAQQREIDSISGMEETPLLYRVTNQLSISPQLFPGDLEYDVNDVICGQHWPLPESLCNLAEISDFRLYVTTTIDHLMLKALCGGRVKGEAPTQFIFKRGGNKSTNDLPENFASDRKPAVFHLFGAACTDPGGFAATEDALIEFSWALIDKQYAPERLYDFLREKTLLLLGCDFPDWLSRFFIHALTRQPDAQISVIYVSGCRPSGLHDFLRRKRSRPLPPMSPMQFVAELYQRWKARQAKEMSNGSNFAPVYRPSESKNGAVFISYAREDRAAAIAIRAQLEAARIDTWMDESELEPGAEFQYVIQDNIRRASFFIPVISRTLDLDGSDRPGRFVLKEWHWAEDVNLEHRKDDCFFQPVVVDDTPSGASFIERPIRNLHWTRLCDGKLPSELIDCLTRGIRRFRGSTGATKP